MTRGGVAATNNSKQQNNKQQTTGNVQRTTYNNRQNRQREQQELFNNNKNKWKEHVVGGSSSTATKVAMAEWRLLQGSEVRGQWVAKRCRVDCGSYVIGMPFCMWLGVTKQQPITKYEKWQLATKAQKKEMETNNEICNTERNTIMLRCIPIKCYSIQ